jgi:hypothetical protein
VLQARENRFPDILHQLSAIPGFDGELEDWIVGWITGIMRLVGTTEHAPFASKEACPTT